MTKQEKLEVVEDLTKRLSAQESFYVVDAEGLTVEEVNDFRQRCFKEKVVYQVVKNTLVGKALKNLERFVGVESFHEKVLKRFSGVLFSSESGSLPARIIRQFRKDRGLDIPVFKGASVGGEVFIGDQQLEVLSKLKSKEELVVGLLQAPASRVVSALQSGGVRVMGVLDGLSRKEG